MTTDYISVKITLNVKLMDELQYFLPYSKIPCEFWPKGFNRSINMLDYDNLLGYLINPVIVQEKNHSVIRGKLEFMDDKQFVKVDLKKTTPQFVYVMEGKEILGVRHIVFKENDVA
jgi:hypothetical protein